MSSSEEEEEILLHVEFNGMLEKNLLENPSVCKIIGLNSKQPVMQIGNQVSLPFNMMIMLDLTTVEWSERLLITEKTFSGEYKDTVGTAMFFEEDDNPPGGDPVFSKPSEHQLRYLCKTRKALHMSRVFLKKKFKQEKDTYSTSDESDVDPDHDVSVRAKQDNVTADYEKLFATPSNYEPVAGPSWAPDVPYIGTVPPFKS